MNGIGVVVVAITNGSTTYFVVFTVIVCHDHGRGGVDGRTHALFCLIRAVTTNSVVAVLLSVKYLTVITCS